MIRDDRAHELRRLRRDNPQQLIALYRAAMGQDELGQLPAGSSFSSMIDAILEHELQSGKLDREPPQVPDVS
jgi:hypothetical protein